MTDQKLMQLVEEAGMFALIGPLNHLLDHEIACLQRFANLVAEREREACAKLVENQRYAVLQAFRTYTADELVQSLKSDAKTLAKMIRSRGEKENEHG